VFEVLDSGQDKDFELDNFSIEHSNTTFFRGQVKSLYLVTE